jgi:hypothetical protein
LHSHEDVNEKLFSHHPDGRQRARRLLQRWRCLSIARRAGFRCLSAYPKCALALSHFAMDRFHRGGYVEFCPRLRRLPDQGSRLTYTTGKCKMPYHPLRCLSLWGQYISFIGTAQNKSACSCLWMNYWQSTPSHGSDS